MKELLSWFLYPIACGPTTEILYIPQICTIWNGINIKYDIHLLFTLLPQTWYSSKLSFLIKAGYANVILSEWNVLKHWKKIKIEDRTTYNLDTSSFVILILSPQKWFSGARAISSIGLSKQTSLGSSTSVTDFLPKINKVHVQLGIAHQGCFCALFWGITRAFTPSKMELFVALLNDFQPLTNVSKNSILDVAGVLSPSLFLYIEIFFQSIDTYCITNWKDIRCSSWKALWIKTVIETYLKKDPRICG